MRGRTRILLEVDGIGNSYIMPIYQHKPFEQFSGRVYILYRSSVMGNADGLLNNLL